MKQSEVILFIDTSDNREISVAIEKGGKRYVKKSSSKSANAQMVLPLLTNLLGEQSLAFHDISKINVHTGPGSFTGLRVGISIANMLGNLLNIPVNDLPIGIPVTPQYEQSKFDRS